MKLCLLGVLALVARTAVAAPYVGEVRVDNVDNNSVVAIYGAAAEHLFAQLTQGHASKYCAFATPAGGGENYVIGNGIICYQYLPQGSYLCELTVGAQGIKPDVAVVC